MDTRVVVVGAGPTGLMLAGELALGGVDVVVLDRLTTPNDNARALGMHARTMEVLDQRGLLERLRPAVVGSWGHFGALSLDFGRLDGAHPGQMFMPQNRTERMLAEWVRELGVEIRRGHELRDLAQDDEGVTAQVDGPDGGYELRAAYLVGCDGGRSTVRKVVGFDFPGTDATTEFLLADVTGIDLGLQTFTRNERGLYAVIPLGDGVYRILPYEFGTPPRRRTAPPTFAEVAAVHYRVTGQDIGAARPLWVSAFGDATRQVTEYRRGRVLLAGDAAHVHFPAGGQGLNLGVQDAVNLGWKLAAELSGWASPGLLDTYHAERNPVGARVLLNTRAQGVVMYHGTQVEPLRAMLRELFDIPEVNDHLIRMISAVEIRYDVGVDGHPLVGRRIPHVELSTSDGKTSTTALLNPARGVLLDLADDAELRATAANWAGRVDIVTAIAPNGDLDRTAAVLLRPDGYVAWAAPGAGGLAPALRRWFGMSGSSRRERPSG
ncbi:putative oxygenase [Longimycelium tulufanense]|uniref:Putative oxygenase n=1 Tax=Longimycelium tulufanense TaxID=907463 RepID=A0A8J3FSZ3_9PSEU|nr:FAD-dependent monooxygenase [Longimycelium tulufanense]GGM44249.1 putative oxygenase [Longimycelium tulufanense]